MLIGLILGGVAAACTLGKGVVEESQKEKKMKTAVSEEVSEQTSDIRNSMALLDARVGVLEQESERHTRSIEELKTQFHIT